MATGEKWLFFPLSLFSIILPSVFRGLKDMEQDISSIEKRFAYGFLQKLLKWMDIAQEFIAHLGTVACQTSNL